MSKKTEYLRAQWHWIKQLIIVIFRRKDIKNNIPRSTSFGHYGIGVVISGAAKIGENCFIGQNVTIGKNNGSLPEIGDNCRVHCNSVVIGCKVGHDSVVGAGSVVTKDVPPYSLVVGFNRVYENKYKKQMEGFK